MLFVHGCFWHQHSDPECKLRNSPRSNQDYWVEKLRRNVERDRKNRAALEAAGWQVVEIWECQTKDLAALESLIAESLKL